MIESYDEITKVNDNSLNEKSFTAEIQKAVDVANNEIGINLEVDNPDRINLDSNLNGSLGKYFFYDVNQDGNKIGTINAFRSHNSNYIHIFFTPI